MNVFDINSKQFILEELIDNAIFSSIASIKSTRKLQEPDYVAALSTTFSKSFFHILSACFPRYDFSVSSIFCHQKPIVKFNSKKDSELGDILFVYKDINENGEVKLNSLLLQAKVNRSNNEWLAVGKNDLHQLELYKKWPEFTYSKGTLKGNSRNIFPKSINSGAQYLIIHEESLVHKSYWDAEPPFMYCAVPDNILYYDESFSNELINLLKFKSGRTFDESSDDTEDDWSKMIWDLFKILGNSCSKRKNINLDSFKRWNEYNHFCTNDMTMKSLLDDFVNEDINGEAVDDEDLVMSVILIESQPKERYEE